MSQSQRILAVVNDRALYEKVAQPLARSSFEVNRVPSGAGALILVGNLRYDLILLEAPLPDLNLADFLAAVRTIDSPCVGSSVIVLAPAEETANLSEAQLEDDINVVDASAEPAALQSEISQALGVAVRARTRLLVQIEASLDEGPFQRVGQTANISETGVLLTGTPAIPLGSRLNLALELPGDPLTLSLTGEVVRHTSPEEENVTGIGVRFVDVTSENAERLREFVHKHDVDLVDNEREDQELELEEPAGSVG